MLGFLGTAAWEWVHTQVGSEESLQVGRCMNGRAAKVCTTGRISFSFVFWGAGD